MNKYTLIWEDSVCQFKEFSSLGYMCDYIIKNFKEEALWSAKPINDVETIWFVDKKWNEDE